VISIRLCCLDLICLSLIFSRVIQPALFGLVLCRHCRPHPAFVGLAPEKLNFARLDPWPGEPGPAQHGYSTPVLAETVKAAITTTIATILNSAKPIRCSPVASATLLSVGRC